MKNTRFLFRAWIPAIQTMLYEVAVYRDGMIGIDPETFEGQLNPAYEFDGEEIYTKLSDDGKTGRTLAMTAMTGDDWLFFDDEDVILMQYTDKRDIEGKAVWEGDIVEYTLPPFMDPLPVGDPNIPSEPVTYREVVECRDGCYSVETIPLYAALDFNLFVLSNIHENPELITQLNNPT